MQPEEIKSVLQSSIENSEVEVSVEGSHVMVSIVSDAFDGLMPVKRQQTVYACLQDAISSGAIHAVHMKLFTQSEWAKASA